MFPMATILAWWKAGVRLNVTTDFRFYDEIGDCSIPRSRLSIASPNGLSVGLLPPTRRRHLGIARASR